MRTLILLLLSIVSTVAQARPVSVTAHGEAIVVKNQRAQAEQAAVDRALHEAVTQMVQSLGGPAEGEDAAVDAAIFARIDPFIVSHRIASQNSDGNVLEVEVAVEINRDALSAALGKHKRSSAKQGQRRVLILATEQLAPDEIFGWTDYVFGAHVGPNGVSVKESSKTKMFKAHRETGGVEATMSGGFTSAGFRVVDLDTLRGKLAPKPAVEVLDLSAPQARSIANKADADFVVVVKGVAQTVRHEMVSQAGMHSGQANVVARFIRVRDGRVMASSTQHAAQVHIDLETAKLNALNEAARLATVELTQKIGQ